MRGVIGFAGMSHLGLLHGTATAAKGFRVIGFDPRADLVERLTRQQLPVHEPGLDDLLQANRDRISFTSAADELQACDVVFLSIDIPTGPDNQSDLGAIDRLADTIVPQLKSGAVLVVLSQVRPGYTRQLGRRLATTLKAHSIHLYYQVETLIFGRAVDRALKPERYMVGCPNSGTDLPPVYENWLAAFDCPILRMRYESAELAKIAINIFLTASVTATNTLAEVCERIGADWGEIAPALRLDQRIGPHAYLSPGLGLSGGNLERDLATVLGLAAEHGTDARLIDAFCNNSHYRRDWALRTLHEHLHKTSRQAVIAVWGLAYKPDTHSTKNSPSLAFLEALQAVPVRPGNQPSSSRLMRVQAFDPQVRLDVPLGSSFRQADDPLDACEGADALVIMTPWSQFRSVNLDDVLSHLRRPLVIDPFGCLDGQKHTSAALVYFRLGSSSAERNFAA